MDDMTVSAAMTRASELVLRELVVALVDGGAIERAEAVRAYLRAEITAALHDEEAGGEATPCAGFLRLLKQEIEGRLGAKPEFHTLRQARERWQAARKPGPDPWEPQRRRR